MCNVTGDYEFNVKLFRLIKTLKKPVLLSFKKSNIDQTSFVLLESKNVSFTFFQKVFLIGSESRSSRGYSLL